MFVMAAAFMSILLLMVARHHPPSRRKIKEIWHGRVYWEQESNTTFLRVPIYNKTLSDLKSSPTPEEDKPEIFEEDKPETNSVKVDKIKIDINVDENLVHIDSQEQKIRLKIGDFKKSQNKPYDFKMIVLVHSARSYKKRRDTIRATWAKGHGNVFFMVGKHCPFKPEQRKWGKWNCVLKDELKNKPMSDIIDEDYIREQEKLTEQLSKEENVILLDMIDVYRHTSMKLRHGWLWALKNTNADYIVKTDDDAFARVDSLEHWLMNRKKHEYEGISHHWAGGTVHRGGKWGERKYKKGSSATYPPWPAGPGWLFSRPVIEYFATHQDSYVDYQGEDTAVGIWMNRIKSELTIKLSTSQHFHVHSGDCHNRNYFMVGHNISPQKMRDCFKTLDEFPAALKWKSSQKCECGHGDPDLNSKECLCKCERGYSGKRCEIANKCSSEQITCQNDGIVSGITGECACTCQKYYEGTHCEIYKWPMTYFIQMNKEERINHVATMMEEHPRLNAKIWNAITPDTMHDEIYSKYVNKKTFEKVRAGAVGCALSHVTVLKHFLASDARELLVFEDDAEIDPDFENKYIKFRENLPNDFDICQLLHHPNPTMKKMRTQKKYKMDNTYVMKAYGAYGTAALLYSRKGAKKLLDLVIPIYYTIDDMIIEHIRANRLNAYMPVDDLTRRTYPFKSNIWNTKKNSNPLKKKPPKTLPKICSFFQPQFDKTTFELITQMINFFHQLSEELSFDYSIIAGTALGYYRHNKNFVPWDDDFDVYLKEDKFISAIKKRIDNSPTLCYKSLWLGFKIYFCDRPKIITNPTYNVDWSWPALDVYTNEHDDPRKKKNLKGPIWPSKLSTISKIPIRIPNNLEKYIPTVFGTRALEMCLSVGWSHKTERGQTQKKIACKELVEKCGSQWPKDTWPIETPVKDVLTRETDKDTCKEYPRHKKCSPIDESKYKKDIISTVEPIRVPSLDYTYPLCPWVTDGMGYPRTGPDGIRKLTGNKRTCVDRLMKWAREGRTTFTFDAGGLVSSTTSGGLGFGLDDFDMYIASEDGLVKDLYAHCPEVHLGNHGMVWLPKRTASNYRDKFVEQADRMCTCELDGPFLCVKTAMDDTPTVESLNFGPGVWDYYGPTWSERNWQKRRPIVLDDDRGSAFMSVKCMFGSAYWMRPSTGGKALQNNFILQWVIPGTGLYKQEPWLNANIKWCSAMGFSASKLTMENIIHWADINIEKGYQNPFWLNRMFKKSPCFIENSRAFMQNACSFLQKAKEARKNTDKLSEVFESFHGAKVLTLTDPEQQIICRKNVLKELCGPGEFKGRWEGDRFRCFDETSDFVDDWKKKIDKVLPSPDTFFPKCVWPKPLYPKSNWKALSSTKKEKVIAALNILKNKVIDDQKYFMYVDSGMVLGLYRDGKWVEDSDIDVRYGHVDGQVMSQSMLSMNNLNKYGAFWPSNLMNSVRNPTISEVAYIRNRTCIHDSMIVLEQKYMVDFLESYYGPSWFVKLPNPGKYHSFMPYWSSAWKKVFSTVKRIDTDNDSEIDLVEMIEYMKKDGADPKQIKAQLSEEKLCKGRKTLTWFLNHPNFIQKDFKQMEDRKYIDNIFSFPECEQHTSSILPSQDNVMPSKCSKIYLDLGTNIGVQIRKLFEPSKYPKAKILGKYNEVFGPFLSRRKDVCAFGFEANPRHNQILEKLQGVYNKIGWKTNFFNRVVWKKNGETMKIYSDDENRNEDWGAGVLDTKIPNKSKMTIFEIPTIDIASWLQSIIDKYNPEVVMVKMDIEGSEYEVIPHLLAQNMLCKNKIKFMYMEIHAWASSRAKKLDIKTIRQQIEKQTCEPTTILDIDDETYLHDGMSLPTIEQNAVVGTSKDNVEQTLENPCFAFVHIPKTAGTSMKRIAETNNICHVSKQACFDDMKMDYPHKYTTVMVRNPFDHVKSQFLMCRNSKWGKNVRSKEFPHNDNEEKAFEIWLRHFISLDDTQVGAKYDFNCIDPRNTQTRHLSCSKPEKTGRGGHPPNHALNQPLDITKALQNLRDASLIGLTEHFDEFICMLQYKFNLKKINNKVHETHGVKNSSQRLNIFQDMVAKLTQKDDIVYREALEIYNNLLIDMPLCKL